MNNPVQFTAMLKRIKQASGLSDYQLAQKAGFLEADITRLLYGRKKYLTWQEFKGLLEFVVGEPWGLQTPMEAIEFAEAAGHRVPLALLRQLFPTANLPADTPIPLPLPANYISRPNLEEQVMRDLEGFAPIVLVGREGIGKTSLIAAVANRLWEHRFSAGVLYIKMTKIHNDDDLLTQLAKQINAVIRTQQELQNWFYVQPYLICLDNITPLQEGWLADWPMPRGQSRCLLATQHQQVADQLNAITLVLPNFTKIEALWFLRAWTQQNLENVPWAIELVESVDRSPITLKWVAQQLKKGVKGEDLLNQVKILRSQPRKDNQESAQVSIASLINEIPLTEPIESVNDADQVNIISARLGIEDLYSVITDALHILMSVFNLGGWSVKWSTLQCSRRYALGGC